MTSGQSFGLVSCEGYGATGYVSGFRAKMDFYAAETWTDSAQGTRHRLRDDGDRRERAR